MNMIGWMIILEDRTIKFKYLSELFTYSIKVIYSVLAIILLEQ